MSGTVDKWATRTVEVECEFSDEELEMLEGRASIMGLTLEEYIRTCIGLEP